MKIQTSWILVPVAAVAITAAALIAGHAPSSTHEYNMQDMLKDIKQCTDADLVYHTVVSEPVPRAGDPGGRIIGIECSPLWDNGTIRANASSK